MARRGLRSAGQRQSRAFQFRPGHVGGRIASAQPVPWRQTIGTVKQQVDDPFPVILRPDHIWDVDETTTPGQRTYYDPVIYVGGGGQNTLRDSSNSTYITIGDSTATDTARYATIQFEAAAIPAGSTITSVDMVIRARTTDQYGDLEPTVAEDIHPTGEFNTWYVSWYYWNSAHRTPDTTWEDVLFESAKWTYLPTAALLRSGKLQCSLSTQSPGGTIDISEVWLVVSGSP